VVREMLSADQDHACSVAHVFHPWEASSQAGKCDLGKDGLLRSNQVGVVEAGGRSRTGDVRALLTAAGVTRRPT
jgi:hypothetical protein